MPSHLKDPHMKHYLLYLIMLLASSLQSQQYFNKIIPFPFGNPNPVGLTYHNGKYLIPVIYPGDTATIIATDFNNDNYYHFEKFDFSKSPTTIINDDIFLFAKDRSQAKGLQIARLKEDFSYDWKKDIDTEGDYNFPISSSQVDGYIYNAYIYEENTKRRVGITKVDPQGNIEWNKQYNEPNIEYSVIWDIEPTRSKKLIAGYVINYKNNFETYARVLEIDSSGKEIWVSDTLYNIDSWNTSIRLVELSDSSIFVTFTKDMHKDPEYVFDWHPYPPTYIWLDKDGHMKKEHVLKIRRDHEVYISELKAGRGDYFYIFGQLKADDDYNLYGFITKYNNNGDTIWTHRYRHPAYNAALTSHYVEDIIEEDNGDLTVQGAITPIGGKPEVWVFRVNSEGCFGTDSCDELTLADGRHDVTDRGIRVYPNPASGMLYIDGLPDHDPAIIRIYSIDGRLVSGHQKDDRARLDISDLRPGMYIVQVSGRTWSQAFKIIKQ